MLIDIQIKELGVNLMKPIGLMSTSQRRVSVFEIPSDDTQVLIVSTPANGSEDLCCIEPRGLWKRVIKLFPVIASTRS